MNKSHLNMSSCNVYIISGNFSISLFASIVLIVGEEGKTKISNGGGDCLAEPLYFDCHVYKMIIEVNLHSLYFVIIEWHIPDCGESSSWKQINIVLFA